MAFTDDDEAEQKIVPAAVAMLEGQTKMQAQLCDVWAQMSDNLATNKENCSGQAHGGVGGFVEPGGQFLLFFFCMCLLLLAAVKNKIYTSVRRHIFYLTYFF